MGIRCSHTSILSGSEEPKKFFETSWTHCAESLHCVSGEREVWQDGPQFSVRVSPDIAHLSRHATTPGVDWAIHTLFTVTQNLQFLVHFRYSSYVKGSKGACIQNTLEKTNKSLVKGNEAHRMPIRSINHQIERATPCLQAVGWPKLERNVQPRSNFKVAEQVPSRNRFAKGPLLWSQK